MLSNQRIQVHCQRIVDSLVQSPFHEPMNGLLETDWPLLIGVVFTNKTPPCQGMGESVVTRSQDH